MSWIVVDASVTLSWCFPDIYVELAMRSGSPLATLDENQRDAAVAVGVTCL